MIPTIRCIKSEIKKMQIIFLHCFFKCAKSQSLILVPYSRGSGAIQAGRPADQYRSLQLTCPPGRASHVIMFSSQYLKIPQSCCMYARHAMARSFARFLPKLHIHTYLSLNKLEKKPAAYG